MTHDGTRRRNKNYGDSPVPRSGVPITSSVLESCSPMPTLAAGRRHASATCGTASRLPFGSRVESWPPQPSACPATQPPLCRVLLMHAVSSGERRHRCEQPQNVVAASVGIARAASKKGAASVFGVAGKKLIQYVAERCSRVQLGKDSQPP